MIIFEKSSVFIIHTFSSIRLSQITLVYSEGKPHFKKKLGSCIYKQIISRSCDTNIAYYTPSKLFILDSLVEF